MQKMRNLKANMQKILTDCCGKIDMSYKNKTDAVGQIGRAFSQNREGSNSTAGHNVSPLDNKITDRSATGVDTNGVSGLAFANKGEVQAAIQITKIVDAIYNIGSGVRASIGHISESLNGESCDQLPKRAMDGYADLVGALGQIHSGSKVANKAAGAIADALLEKAAEAVNEAPDDDANEATPENSESTHNVSQGDQVSVEVKAPESAVPEVDAVDIMHRVVDLDNDTEVIAKDAIETATVHDDIQTDRSNYRQDQTVIARLVGCKPSDVASKAGLLPVGVFPTYQVEEEQPKLDQYGKPVLGADGKPETEMVEVTKATPMIRPTPIGQNWQDVRLVSRSKSDCLKPGKMYRAWFTNKDQTESLAAECPIRVHSVRNLKSLANESGYSEPTLYKYMANGGIKPENMVPKSKTCNKNRLLEAAIDDLVALGVKPHKKRRARLEKFLARRQPQK